MLKYLAAFLVMTALGCAVPDRGDAYVMPAEQIVGMMAANFSKFKTLEITQSIHLPDLGDQEADTVLEEKIWMKSPAFFHY